MGLELAWGRLRRVWLRRFRPGYVRQMAEKRQGHCPDCPHDIIDPRDLKFYRNVCGYWFRDEDDRFQWRGRLGIARSGLAEVICFSLPLGGATLLLALAAAWLHWGFWLPFAVAITLWAFLISFFRDPSRAIPTDTDVLVSPADGTVTFVGEVEDADFPGGRAFQITIFLSIFNVHVNRVPRTGQVVEIRYFPGCFLDARRPECGVRNEQLWLDLEETPSRRRLRVKQIAGALARRIVCWVRLGEQLQAGARFGMIKFGSRTDLLLPVGEAAAVLVQVGDKVRGGHTILLRLKDASGQ